MHSKSTRLILVVLDMGFLSLLVLLVFAMLHITGMTLTDVIDTAQQVVYNAFAFAN